MSINDKIITRTESFYTDEFEKSQMHKSATVGYFWMSYSCLALAPVIAWLADGRQVYLSFLVLIPTFIGSVTSANWFKKSASRPVIKSMKYLWGWEWALLIVVVVAWIAALNSAGTDSIAYSTGGIIGAIVGMGTAMILIPMVTKRQRQRDQKRLESQLDSED